MPLRFHKRRSRHKVVARCTECDWETDSPSNAIGNASNHTRKTGHKVVVNIKSRIVFKMVEDDDQ